MHFAKTTLLTLAAVLPMTMTSCGGGGGGGDEPQPEAAAPESQGAPGGLLDGAWIVTSRVEVGAPAPEGAPEEDFASDGDRLVFAQGLFVSTEGESVDGLAELPDAEDAQVSVPVRLNEVGEQEESAFALVLQAQTPIFQLTRGVRFVAITTSATTATMKLETLTEFRFGDEGESIEREFELELTKSNKQLDGELTRSRVRISVSGGRAILAGTIDSDTPLLIAELDAQFEVDAIVIDSLVDGIDLNAVLGTAVAIREAGLDTLVTAAGELAPSAFHMFLGGVERRAEEGARLLVDRDAVGGINNAVVITPNSPIAAAIREVYEQLGFAAETFDFLDDVASSAGRLLTLEEMSNAGILTD